MATRTLPEEAPPVYIWDFPYDELDNAVSDGESDYDAEPTMPDSRCQQVYDLFGLSESVNKRLVSYSGKCSGLFPLNAPLNHPRLIHVVTGDPQADWNGTQYHIADAVVTVLWDLASKSLRAFLDCKVKKFSFIDRDSKFGLGSGWTIQRHKSYVMVGFFSKYPAVDHGDVFWTKQVVYRIKPSGAWVPFRGSMDRVTASSTEIIYEALKNSQYQAKEGIKDVDNVVFIARSLATWILMECTLPRQDALDTTPWKWTTSNHEKVQSLEPGKRTGEML